MADRGVRVPEKQLVSTPVVHVVQKQTVEHTRSVGGVTVEPVGIEFYDEKGNFQYESTDKEAIERAGFYSIVTAKDY